MTDKPNTPKGTKPPINQADEDFFAQYLQGDSPLSGIYQQTDSPEPSDQLNQTILTAARQQANKHHWWSKPGSWAATIAIFSLIALLAHNTWQTEQDYLQQDLEQQAFPDAPPKAELKKSSPPIPAAMSPAPQRLSVRPEQSRQRSEQKDTRKPLYKTAPAPVMAIPSENRFSGQTDALLEEESMDALGNLSGISAKDSSTNTSQKAKLTYEAAQEKEQPETYADAQQWLEKIRQLLAGNQTNEAQQLFIKFRKKYPDYPVDPVILQQLSPY